MEEGTKTFLAILVLFLFILALNPSLIGTTVGSMTWGENFSNIWFGLGQIGQTILFIVLAIAFIAILIGSEKK